jgi:hypothetical protein
MSGYDENLRLADVLEPVLAAGDSGEVELREAVNDVAEVMAALGVLIVDSYGAPIFGVSDESAVLGALAAHGRELAGEGRIDDALEVTEIMEKVEALRRDRPEGSDDS